MNSLAFRLVLAVLAALVLHSRAAAEDIDLYAGGGSSGAPNVLFYLDNSSNWSANNQAWSYSSVLAKCGNYSGSARTTCQRYVYQVFCNSTSACTGNPANLVQGQVEVRALKLVLNELACNPPTGTDAVNINAGLMMFNTQGSVDSNSVISGYIRHEIKPLDRQQCAETDVRKSIIADLTNIDANITGPDFKGPSAAEYGAGLYEAFKYFGGWSRPNLVASGAGGTAGSPTGATGFGPTRYGIKNSLEDVNAFTDPVTRATYKSPIDANSCGKNYIILIGNTWPNQEYGTDTSASPYPTNTLMSRLRYDLVPQIYPAPLSNSDKTNVRFADEWAKFLYDTDVNSADGQQRVETFTIDVYNQSQDPKQAMLLKSMATVGRGNVAGGYFAVGGDLLALINALKQTLTQIASVNSVFASASLPVSVNAQGTFLNQVFMGVFRPQENAYQRWAGNMKQYRFALDGDALYLADATNNAITNKPNPAVDTSSGFILNCAVSYGTTDSGTYWRSVTGTASSCGDATYAALDKYSDLPDGPLVERGGGGQQLRNLGYAARNIRTCTDNSCSSVVDFNTTNVTIPGTGLSKGTDSATLVNWARGQNVGDGNSTFDPTTGNLDTTKYPDSTGATVTTRPTVHGEVVHSRPLAVNYGSGSTNDVVVFYGAGDGMLHAVNGNQAGTGAGSELWAFIAPEHWSSTDSTGSWNLLDRVHSNYPLIKFPGVTATGAAPKTYFFDGSIGGYQEVTSGALSKLWIYPTMRRGGRAVYAFNATNKPGTGGNQPTLMWKFSSADNSNLGQTWSTPVAIRVKIGTATTTLVAFGAGYDSCEDDSTIACTQGRGIFVMDAGTGKAANYRFFDPGSTAGRFVADVTAVDVNGDGIIDLLYAVDTRGNIWRINTTDPNNSFASYSSVANWPINQIAAVSDWTTASERRKFMYAPSVVMLGTQATVLVGTGDREKPLASGSAALVNNRFYGIRDDITKTGGTTATTPTVVNGFGTDAALASANQLTNVTGATTTLDPATLALNGWYRNLFTTSTPFEQVVTSPLTIGGLTYFSTFQPKPASTGTNQCSNLGVGRAYKVDFQTGVISPNSVGAYAPDTFSSQGIPPSPVGGLVSIDGKTLPFCIGCSGPTVLSPNKIVPKVKPDRKPVYRYQKIDS
ncbi:MAG TPA: PilC/PilY family type IV pilus protein [Duganella sp.]|nr:PilC/PilY family type IV pilus protein [Duganella sp.]